MQPEAGIATADVDVESTESNIVIANGNDNANGRPTTGEQPNSTHNATATQARFPPPKTDKPRPHVCGTCGRSFARLEHLKRHERSHTKEKPFECPECARCFARRDLLLRHQQKLHMTNTTSSRPRSGRRESTSAASVTGAKVRKNSMANANVASPVGMGAMHHRPRANTISHIDLSSLGLLDDSHPSMSRMNGMGLVGQQMGGAVGGSAMAYDYRGMSTAMGSHGNIHALPKLDTHAVNHLDMSNTLRTAPPHASFGGFDIDQLFSPGTTINPAQLHFGGPASATQANFPPLEPFTVHPAIDPGAQADDFGWMRGWNMQMPYDNSNEQAIEESSPSRMSSGDSPPDFPDGFNTQNTSIPIQHNNFQWPHLEKTPQPSVSSAPFQLDVLSSGLPDLDPPQNTISPNTLHDQTPTGDTYFHQAMMQRQQQQLQQQHQHQQRSPQQQQPQQQPQPQQPALQLQTQRQPQQARPQPQQHSSVAMAEHLPQDMMQNQQPNLFPPSISNISSDSPSIMSSSSMAGSGRQSSVTSASTLSITDATRQAMLLSLSRANGFGHSGRKYSQPSVSSPLSPSSNRSPLQGPNLPSTTDIRRYVDAFIQYGHPHLPVTHMATLSFDPLDFGISKGSSSPLNLAQSGIVVGGGCLILGMAAIGALYEYEHPASKELFEGAKKMITLYLEERRKANMSTAVGDNSGSASQQQTPLWLVQAMLLSVIYGHMCGDRMAADIASTHCAALVSLARAAELAQPPSEQSPGSFDPGSQQQQQQQQSNHSHGDVEMGDDGIVPSDSISRHQSQETDLHSQWMTWKVAEERKRTLFAIFILSSLLTTAYNQNPTIMNSEILLDLPCDEELYAAETAQKWQERGGLAAAEQDAVSFASALSTLLTANKRQGKNVTPNAYTGNGVLPNADDELRPSTFGCLVLINALHNYIWETRSRHHGRQWTAQETESMFSHIEPALNAWQAAWKANNHHKLERPNPFGFGPLAADSIPLLDLAFVRLFVNLGRSKEAFWQRDFDAMADELARGAEIVQHAGGSPDGDRESGAGAKKSPSNQRRQSLAPPSEQASTRRERHLRKAAFYAADSLMIACSYNLTYTDMTAHELPIQSAMCFFDCCQVLAEWACTVQERVGRYLGVLGRDQIDLSAVPAIMLLENEDIELLRKIEGICDSLEQKRFQQEHLLSMDLQNMNNGLGVSGLHNNVNLGTSGHGSKILRITAMMLEKAVVWPITHVMAKSLETQAHRMDQRADASTVS